MKNVMDIKTRESGFSLAEMSIVMIVIGFLVGGVVVGQDMIRAAGVRATVSQIKEYQTAVNTFNDKYMAIPGDIRADKAAMYGFTARSGEAGHGDGNGLLEGCDEGEMVAGCETVLFWADLSDAELIRGDYEAVDDIIFMAMWRDFRDTLELLSPIQSAYAGKMMSGNSGGQQIGGDAEAGDPMQIEPVRALSETNYSINMRHSLFPRTDLEGNVSIATFSDGKRNYMQFAEVVETNGDGEYTLASKTTPDEALAIDTKMDDGKPMTGEMRAMGGTSALNVAAVPGAESCVYDDGSTYPYNTTTSELANSPLCQFRIPLQ